MWQNLIGDISKSDWRSFNTFSPRHVASFDWPKCFDFQGDTCNTRLDCMRHRLHVPGCLRHRLHMLDRLRHRLHVLDCLCNRLRALMCD